MNLFDSHAHFQDSRFAEDRDAALSEAFAGGVSHIVNVGTDLATSREAICLAEAYAGCYAAIGVHPHDSGSVTEADYSALAELCKHPKVVAIGEIGLDYYWDDMPRDVQKQWFCAQMELARELNMPVVIHDREAHGDTFDIICRYPEVVGVMHSYSGSIEMASQYLKRGWYISFSGKVNSGNALAVYTEGFRSCAVCTAIFNDTGIIAGVYTNAEHRGKGYGKIAVSGLLDAMCGKGISSALLWCEDKNISFYEKIGFSRTGEIYYSEVI
jgi:TatD DNase family protein